MRTQSHVCENPISSFVNVYIDPGKPQGLPHTGAFLEIEAGGCPRYRCPRALRADEIHALALVRPRVFCCIVIANADCACSIGRGRDL